MQKPPDVQGWSAMDVVPSDEHRPRVSCEKHMSASGMQNEQGEDVDSPVQ